VGALSLIPKKAGDRVKTNRRDAISLVLFLTILWFNIVPPIFEKKGTDVWVQTLDKYIKHNMQDFTYWYKANIMLQAMIILTALAATILASLTTNENAGTLKKYSILVTAITSAFTAIQSTFHIRENIEAFIRANSELQLLEMEYLINRAGFTENQINGKEASPGLLKVQYELAKKYVAVESARMRAYASIGAQSLPGAPSLLAPPASPPSSPESPGSGAKPPALESVGAANPVSNQPTERPPIEQGR
jgi:hypothetical protein